MSHAIEMRHVMAIVWTAVDSTLLKPERPAVAKQAKKT